MPIKNQIRLLLAQHNVERARRGEKPVSLRRLAAELDIAHAAFLKLVSGRSKRIDFETIEKLCAYFDVQVGDLFKFERERTSTPECK